MKPLRQSVLVDFMATNAKRGRPASNQSAIYCAWAQGVIVFFLLALGWAVFTELIDMRSKPIDQPFQSLPGQHQHHEHDQTVNHEQVIHLFPTVNCSFVSSILIAANQQLTRIRKDWQIESFPKFLDMLHVPESSWDLQKAKFIKLIIENSSNKTQIQQTYVAGFSGSSITAGHGRRNNFLYEAFPQVFHTRLLPVITAMRMKLDTRNHAIGNNPCFPYDACIATHLGDDLDLLTWEQSMNCGRDSRPLDTFTRNSLHTGRTTAVIYTLSGGPTWTAADCINITTNTIPDKSNHSTISLRSRAGSSQLMQIMDFLTDKHSASSGQDHIERIYERYAAASPMALSTFPIAKYRCLGPYDDNFSMKSTGSGGASWHPGKRGHQLRGDALAYFLLEIIVDAAKEVELLCTNLFAVETGHKEAIKAQGPTALVSKTAAANSNNTASVPTSYNNTLVAAVTSSTHKRHVLRRLSTSSSSAIQEVTWNNIIATLSSLTNIYTGVNLPELKKKISTTLQAHPNSLIDHSAVYMHSLCSAYLAYFQSQKLLAVPSHYDIPETTYAPTCYTDYLPRQMQNMSITNLIHPPKGKWTKELSWFDKSAVEKAERKKLGYLDRKYIYRSNGNGTSIGLRISTKHNAPLWLCELQKGFLQYPATMTDLDDGAEISIRLNFPSTSDNVTGASTLKTKVSISKKVEIQHFIDQCYRTLIPVPPGEHLLMITQRAGKQINLAYVISW